MQKLLAFLVLLMLPWVARGQALADWYYWFDLDATPQDSGKVSELKFRLQPDVSHLPSGMHTLYVQVMDTAGVYSTPVGTMFYKVSLDTHPTEFRYWFDSDATVRTMPYGQGHYILDVAHLTPGFHFINYYVADGEENMTRIDNAGFFRLPVASNQKLHYWFAGDTVATHVHDYRNGFIVDVTRLQECFNTIYFQMEDNGPTDIMTEHFIKVPQTENGGDMTLVCIIDGKIVGEEKVAAQGGVVKCDMDVSNMVVGLHKAMFQLITPSGAGSSIAETYFIRTLTNEDVASMQCSYTIDGFHHRVHKGSSTNGVFHFDLPVDDVEVGLHRIDYMLVAENGASTTQGSAWFFKTPVGGNGIKQYDYWLNDKTDNVQSVTIDEPKDPFQLIKLLPVTAEPIRSSCFHFEVKDGKPMMYAKNDIHFRFIDKSGRWVDESKQYVDYNVSQAVTDITELHNTQTFERPEENNIKWLKFEALEGDTIAFKASQATSIQVFAPSGEEIYSASGDKSVKYNGTHTWEDGTYYVAIHDVTGSKQSVTLNYMHMDKYDVVNQNVHVIGDGAASTITYDGNGFKDLYAVDYISASGDTLKASYINHISDAKVGVVVDAYHAELSKYKAVFHFTEQDISRSENIKIEPAKAVVLEATVSYPSRYLIGSNGPTYTITIKNKGNMTSYKTPITIYFESANDIKSINVEGLNLPSLEEVIDVTEGDSITHDDMKMINRVSEKVGDNFYFLKSSKRSNAGGGNSGGRRTGGGYSGFFFGDIPGGGSLTAQFTPNNGGGRVSGYVSVPHAGTPLSAKGGGSQSGSGGKKGYCCIKDKIECAVNMISFGLGFANPIADCAGGLFAEGLEGFGKWYCRDENDGSGDWNALHSIGEGSGVAGAIANCLSLNKKYDKFKEVMHAIDDWGGFLGDLTDVYDCYTAFTERNPDCDQDPPQGGTSDPVNSFDPNDIYGYTHESGSKFINNSIQNVYYRIEFENDTTFATASAHVVEVKDTLDGKYFDLSSYAPTSVKIGDKVEYLDGTPNFVKTVDMRPAINTIAQVEGKYDTQKGIATWLFTSLDPMTMEPTDDIMQGFLPVNYDGISGIGEVLFDINLKQRFEEGTEIPNKASIVFDANDPIMTPTWVNTIDATAPTSHVTNVEMKNDSTFTINFEGEDNLSGVWHYDVYYRWKDDMDWICIANGCDSTAFDKTAVAGYNYEFCVLATDSAGNVEQKVLTPEFKFYTGMLGDVNNDGAVTVADVSGVVSIILEEPGTENMNAMAADVNRDRKISVADASGIVSIILDLPLESKARRMEASRSEDSLDISPIIMNYGETVEIPVCSSQGNGNYTAMQFDMSLPVGVELVGVKGTSEHVCRMAKLSSGKQRIICFSPTNEMMTSHTLTLVLKASDKPVASELRIDDIEFVGTKQKAYHPEFIAVPVLVGDATSIDAVKGEDAEGTTYDLNGRKVRDAQKGIYIQDGKSVYIDK